MACLFTSICVSFMATIAIFTSIPPISQLSSPSPKGWKNSMEDAKCTLASEFRIRILVLAGILTLLSSLTRSNISGRVSIDKDDNWVCSPFTADDMIHSQIQRLPNPVAETEQSVCILEEYLQQRGVFLPQGYLSYRVICPNPNFRSTHSFPPEVITYDQWTQLQPVGTSFLSGWIKSKEKKMQESLSEKLNSVLSTAPAWDRLELKDDKQILGEFVRFKANNADILALRKIERSKVAHLTIEKKGASTVRVSYVLRDYRVGRSSLSSQEVKVNSNAELVFRPQNSTNLYEVKLSTVVSLYLSV